MAEDRREFKLTGAARSFISPGIFNIILVRVHDSSRNKKAERQDTDFTLTCSTTKSSTTNIFNVFYYITSPERCVSASDLN